MTFTIHPNRLAIHAAVHRISLEVLRQIGGHDGNAPITHLCVRDLPGSGANDSLLCQKRTPSVPWWAQ